MILYILFALAVLVWSPVLAKVAFHMTKGWLTAWKEAMEIVRK